MNGGLATSDQFNLDDLYPRGYFTDFENYLHIVVIFWTIAISFLC